MADYNLGAKEFIPSWLKKPVAAPEVAAAPPAPPTRNDTKRPASTPPPQGGVAAVGPPAQIPWKAPPVAAVSVSNPVAAPRPQASASQAPQQKRHMNPNAVIFEPKFAQPSHPPAAQRAPPLVPPPPQAAQWPAAAPKRSPHLRASGGVAPTHILPPSSQPISLRSPAATPKVVPDADPQRLSKKSVDEILAISKSSKLKVGAAVFVPGRSQHAAKTLLGKPSPLTLTPAQPDLEMLLFDTWSLYCLCNSVTKVENYDPTQVFRIDSVPTFWKVMNNLPEPTELSPPTTMYLFRDDINPKWEDKKNVSGGMWKMRVTHDRIDAVWLVLLCKTIGESWLKEFRNTINGVVLKARDKGFYIEIWVTEKKDLFPSDLADALSEQLPGFMIDYYTHQQIQEVMSKKDVPKKGGKKNAKRK